MSASWRIWLLRVALAWAAIAIVLYVLGHVGGGEAIAHHVRMSP